MNWIRYGSLNRNYCFFFAVNFLLFFFNDHFRFKHRKDSEWQKALRTNERTDQWKYETFVKRKNSERERDKYRPEQRQSVFVFICAKVQIVESVSFFLIFFFVDVWTYIICEWKIKQWTVQPMQREPLYLHCNNSNCLNIKHLRLSYRNSRLAILSIVHRFVCLHLFLTCFLFLYFQTSCLFIFHFFCSFYFVRKKKLQKSFPFIRVNRQMNLKNIWIPLKTSICIVFDSRNN